MKEPGSRLRVLSLNVPHAPAEVLVVCWLMLNITCLALGIMDQRQENHTVRTLPVLQQDCPLAQD